MYGIYAKLYVENNKIYQKITYSVFSHLSKERKRLSSYVFIVTTNSDNDFLVAIKDR